MDLIYQLDSSGFALVVGIRNPVTQDFSPLEYVTLIDLVQYLTKLVIAECSAIMMLKLRFQVNQKIGFIANLNALIAQPLQLYHQIIFK